VIILMQRIIRKSIGLLKKEPNHEQFQLWRQAQGDKIHRLAYDLNEDSIVLDVGGFEGQWASDIFGMYCCKVHIFEPVTEFARNISYRFQKNKNIIVYPYGLATSNSMSKISIVGDASSIYKTADQIETIQVVKASDFFQKHQISHINLMKINIEGGEYELLEHLIFEGWIQHIQNIQVQFHNFMPDSQKRMHNIQAELSKSHQTTYQYPFVWENWQRKS